MGKVLEATTSFVCEVAGERTHVAARVTRVDEDHPLAKQYPDCFAEVEATFGTEEATDTPGQARNRATARAQRDSAARQEEESPSPPAEPAEPASAASGSEPASSSAVPPVNAPSGTSGAPQSSPSESASQAAKKSPRSNRR